MLSDSFEPSASLKHFKEFILDQQRIPCRALDSTQDVAAEY